MEAAPVQQLADLRGTLNYLAASNLLLPEASLSHCKDAVALRERTMRPGDADTSKFPVLFCCKTASVPVEFPSFRFILNVL